MLFLVVQFAEGCWEVGMSFAKLAKTRLCLDIVEGDINWLNCGQTLAKGPIGRYQIKDISVWSALEIKTEEYISVGII
ncbi:hypothetical protein WG904_02085 [Pedobacter sp. Du54]|uniref:hypothetical protein n=1 Tax=Pedobacter anseongensis TaxID=3133439 RepID=UPI0030A76C90